MATTTTLRGLGLPSLGCRVSLGPGELKPGQPCATQAHNLLIWLFVFLLFFYSATSHHQIEGLTEPEPRKRTQAHRHKNTNYTSKHKHSRCGAPDDDDDDEDDDYIH